MDCVDRTEHDLVFGDRSHQDIWGLKCSGELERSQKSRSEVVAKTLNRVL